MKTKTYFHGDGHSKWGIWNNMRKEFQFGICEDTPLLAERKLRQKIGNDARKWRFEVKQLPCDKKQKEKEGMKFEIIVKGKCAVCGKRIQDDGFFLCKVCRLLNKDHEQAEGDAE